MTANELRKALIELGYKQRYFARKIEKTDSVVSAWCTGRTPVPKVIDLLINSWLDFPPSDADLPGAG